MIIMSYIVYVRIYAISCSAFMHRGILCRCADIQSGLLKAGSYEKYKAVRVADQEVSVMCPKGVVTKPEDVVFVVNKFGKLQVTGRGNDEAQPQPHP